MTALTIRRMHFFNCRTHSSNRGVKKQLQRKRVSLDMIEGSMTHQRNMAITKTRIEPPGGPVTIGGLSKNLFAKCIFCDTL